MNIQELETKIKQLTQEIEQLKQGEKKEEWPKEGDEIWLNNSEGFPVMRNFDPSNPFHQRLKEKGDMYRTEQAALNARLRMQSIETCKWRPKEEEAYYYHDFFDHEVIQTICSVNAQYDKLNVMIGNCHQTKEENEEWYAKFGKAWEEKIK